MAVIIIKTKGVISFVSVFNALANLLAYCVYLFPTLSKTGLMPSAYRIYVHTDTKNFMVCAISKALIWR